MYEAGSNQNALEIGSGKGNKRLSIKSNSKAGREVGEGSTVVSMRAVALCFVLCMNDLEDDAII